MKGLQEMINQGYINVQKHPKEELYIYNYSTAAQYDKMWNEATLQCRGLIMDEHLHIVARPLRKFFNLGELENSAIPNEKFEVYEKMDGSLGILYHWKGKPYIATRGSFASEQALKATAILYDKYAHTFGKLHPEWTYLFEIIYPENRIVVDYGSQEDIILLAVVDTQTGKDLPLEELGENIGFPVVKRYDGIRDFHTLRSLEEENREGFVVKFESGFRLKVKFEEYERLHYILTSVSSLSIWKELSAGGTLNEILDVVPDEFYEWVRKVEKELRNAFQTIEEECKKDFKVLETRRETATYFNTCKHPKILFSMLDGKDYSDYIWRLIKPAFQKPFSGTQNVKDLPKEQ